MRIIKAKINMPEVEMTDVIPSIRLIDHKDLVFKQPNNADVLQSREYYGDASEIEALKSSILQKHLLEAPIVMKNDDGDGYRVLEGNRRCYVLGLLIDAGQVSAANGKSLLKVRCEVRPSIEELTEYKYNEWKDTLSFQPNDTLADEVKTHIRNEIVKALGSDALIRNTQRLNWSPIEQARKIKELIDAGEPLESLSKQFGLSEQNIQTKLNLLSKEKDMPEVLSALDSNAINLSTAKLFANIHESNERKKLLNHVIETNASHEEAKELIDNAHMQNISAGGKGIKTQNRNRPKTKGPQSNARTCAELNEALATLISAQQSYALTQEKDATTNDSLHNLDIAIKVIQWVIDTKNKNTLLNVVVPTTNTTK